MVKSRLAAVSFFLFLAAAAVFFFSPRKHAPGTDLTWGRYGSVPEFELTDAHGRTVRRQDFKGPWIAGFIFTRCAGLCPMMTAQMKSLRREIPSSVQLASISVDPADGPQALERYAKIQRIPWTLLTGKPGQIRKLCLEGFHLPLAEGRSEEEPITHSKNLVLVDSEGEIRGYYDSTDSSAVRELIRRAHQLAAGLSS